jgi:hypothetical protein
MTKDNGPLTKDKKPWIFLALWFAWLGMMVYMSRNEWGVAKPKGQPLQGTLDRRKEKRE